MLALIITFNYVLRHMLHDGKSRVALEEFLGHLAAFARLAELRIRYG